MQNFYDEEIRTQDNIMEFTNGTESNIINGVANIIRDVLRDAAVGLKQIKYTVTGRELQPEDIEFMTKGIKSIRDEWYAAFKKHVEVNGIDKLLKPVKPQDNIQNAYNIFKQYDSTPIPEKLYRVTIASIEISNDTTNYPRLKVLIEALKGKLITYADKEREILEKIPHGFKLDVTQEKLPNGSYMNHLEVYSCKFKSNKLKDASGTESYSIDYVENILSDDFILGNKINQATIFGIESLDSHIPKNTFDDIYDIINAEGGIENFVPVDMDFASYAEFIEGTEGIGNFFARQWGKFRRVLHPLVKSDIKVTQVEYDKIKSTFETTVIRSIPALKTLLQQNRFVKFLMDNGAVELNEKAAKSFGNDSRMVASVLVTLKGSKIKYDNSTGMLTVGGKKIDIMDLRNDDKFVNGNDANSVIYIAINDIIKAINKTVYKQIKGEHVLDKLGFVVKFLNDGKQSRVKQDGSMIYSTADGGIGSASTYKVDETNEITTQISNKDILIGMMSRPLVIKDAGTESYLDVFDEMYEGGTEMANNTGIIMERMKLVEDTKQKIMKTPEFQRYTAGIETNSTETVDRISENNNLDVKELLGKVYDKYGMAGLKDILK